MTNAVLGIQEYWKGILETLGIRTKIAAERNINELMELNTVDGDSACSFEVPRSLRISRDQPRIYCTGNATAIRIPTIDYVSAVGSVFEVHRSEIRPGSNRGFEAPSREN
jgi:hypothetical protein